MALPFMQDPAKEANKYIGQIPGMYEPYQQHGLEAGDILSQILGQMSQDPSGYLKQLMGQYESSPGFDYEMQDALKAGQASAAAGGTLGTQDDIMNQSELAARLKHTDMQDFLNNVMGLQRTGLGGEQSMYQTGYGATGDIGNVLNEQGSLAFQGARESNQQTMDLMKGLMQALASAYGAPGGGMNLGAASGATPGQWTNPDTGNSFKY